MTPKSAYKQSKKSAQLWDSFYKLNKARGGLNYSWREFEAFIGIPRMSIHRWSKQKECLSKCYLSLIPLIKSDIELGLCPNRNTLTTDEVLKKIEELKTKKGSWDKVANTLGIAKRTIMRWRKTKRISKAYRKLLYYSFKETRS